MVDRRVGLDRVDEVVAARQRGDRAPDRRDDADRERVGVAERAADRGDGLRRRPPGSSRRAAPGRARAAPDRRGSRRRRRRGRSRRRSPARGRRPRTRRRRCAPASPCPSATCGWPAVVITWALVRISARRTDDEARALGRARVGNVARVEVRDDRDDPRRAAAEDLGRLEAVAGERLRDDDRARVARARAAPARRRRSSSWSGAEPAGGLADGEHGDAAEHGGDEGDGSSRARAHRRPTVAAPGGACARFGSATAFARFHGETARARRRVPAPVALGATSATAQQIRTSCAASPRAAHRQKGLRRLPRVPLPRRSPFVDAHAIH